MDICPAKNKSETRLKAINMAPQPPLRVPERENWDFFLKLPELDRRKIKLTTIRQQQVQEPLFEFSGACAGCGETPYLKLVSQLFGDRAVDRQCHRLLVDLRRQPADHSLGEECRRPRTSLGELTVRRQRRVRPGLPRLDRQANGIRARTGEAAGAEIGEDLATALLTAPQKDEADISLAARTRQPS